MTRAKEINMTSQARKPKTYVTKPSKWKRFWKDVVRQAAVTLTASILVALIITTIGSYYVIPYLV